MLLPVESVDASEGVEFRDEEIASFVERHAVRRDDEAGAPLVRPELIAANAWFGIRPEPGNDCAPLVENGHLPAQFADDRVLTENRHGGRQEQIPCYYAQEVT
jgi:hypothetical protein